MGFHLALVAKLSLVGSGHLSLTTPLVASLVWPFVIKVLLSLRPIHQVFTNTVFATRLFFFQMGQITFNSQPAAAAGLTDRRTRLRRAIRLVNERIVLARNAQMEENDEESLRAFSVLAL